MANSFPQPDIVIAGAGIIGLSLALELHTRGARVTVLEANAALAQTSSAAAGMLAVDDPANPPALHPLAQLSADLYPAFLDRIADLSQTRVPFQTTSTLEASTENILANPHQLVPQLSPEAPTFQLLAERSVDPRQLAAALLAAVRNTSIQLLEHTSLTRIASTPQSITATAGDQTFTAAFLIDCMGAWSPAPVFPRKGQMLALRTPPALELSTVLRVSGQNAIYIVPRTDGPDTGRLVVGATVEDAGFDLTVHALDILTLNARATRLLPVLAGAEFLESWAGLRPATADGLPFLGPTRTQPRYLLANGHFRNGILLAPATAHLLAQLASNQSPTLDLTPYSPTRL